MKRCLYPSKSRIATAGTPGDRLYLVVNGQCKIVAADLTKTRGKRIVERKGESRIHCRTAVDLALVGPGQFIGERQISASTTAQSLWTEDIIAQASSVLWSLERSDLETHLSHLLPSLRTIAQMKATVHKKRVSALRQKRIGLGLCNALVPVRSAEHNMQDHRWRQLLV